LGVNIEVTLDYDWVLGRIGTQPYVTSMFRL